MTKHEEKLPWIVKIVKMGELQDTLNELTRQGYRIDKYESVSEQYDTVLYMVVGTTVKEEED